MDYFLLGCICSKSVLHFMLLLQKSTHIRWGKIHFQIGWIATWLWWIDKVDTYLRRFYDVNIFIVIDWHSGADMWNWCALPERSMKLYPRRVLGMLISKIAGTMTLLQRVLPKIKKFKMAAPKHVFAHKMALTASINIILMTMPMFLRSRNPIKHIWRLITYIFMVKI